MLRETEALGGEVPDTADADGVYGVLLADDGTGEAAVGNPMVAAAAASPTPRHDEAPETAVPPPRKPRRKVSFSGSQSVTIEGRGDSPMQVRPAAGVSRRKKASFRD